MLIGPSHKHLFHRLAGSSDRRWQTSLGQYIQHPSGQTNQWVCIHDDIHRSEHCLEVQVPFLKTIAPDGSMTCLVTEDGVTVAYVASALIETYSYSIFVISTDLSHYLNLTRAQKHDEKTIDAITHLNLEYFIHNDNCACGVTGILIALTIARLRNWKPILLSYESSASIYGDTRRVVGYEKSRFL